jgi:centrosomal protein CEP290
LLEKNSKDETLNISIQQTEQLNKKYENEIEFLKKELETEKEKSHSLETSLERLKHLPSSYSFAPISSVPNQSDTTGVEQSDCISLLQKRLTAIEMKEINERQRADHAQRMYDEQRNMLRQLENRNLDLEHNMTQLNRNYMNLIKVEQDLRDELSHSVPKAVNDAQKQRIDDMEKQEQALRLEVSRLRELTEITLYQTASLEFINNLTKCQIDTLALINNNLTSDTEADLGRLHRQQIMLQRAA